MRIMDKTQLLVTWVGLLVSSWPLDRMVENFVPRLPQSKDFVYALIVTPESHRHSRSWADWRFSYWMACIICPDLVLNVFILPSYFGFGSVSINNQASKEPLPLNVFFSFCVAFMISSCIDLDHIKDVLQIMNAQLPVLMGRGWLHRSLPPLVLACILYSSALSFNLLWCVTCATLSILSIFSHHIRDGVHHGLDFYPLGTTPVLPYWLYVVVTLILPIVASNLSVDIIQQVRSSLASPEKNLYVV